METLLVLKHVGCGEQSSASLCEFGNRLHGEKDRRLHPALIAGDLHRYCNEIVYSEHPRRFRLFQAFSGELSILIGRP
jgi:hypothetical protein